MMNLSSIEPEALYTTNLENFCFLSKIVKLGKTEGQEPIASYCVIDPVFQFGCGR